jgi:hypothetical protein
VFDLLEVAMKKFILLLALLGSSFSYAEEVPGEKLLSYFSGSCKSYGQWTQIALDDSRALVGYLNSLQNDPDCGSAAGAINQLTNLSSQLAILKKSDSAKETIANYNAEEQELLIQLTKTTNTDAINSINGSLRDIQVKRAVLLNGSRASEKLAGEDYATLLSQVAQSANSSFQQLTAGQKCLDKHPGLLESATKIMASVGSAVTLVNPAMGLAMTGGAAFTTVTMEGIKKSRNAREVRKITDSTTTYQAYKCALESMSERWCQMKDAEAFLKFKASNRQNYLKDKGLAQAITLNDREIPVILDWLNKVRNGVSPRTTADANRRSYVLTRELMVRSRSAGGLSLIEQNRKTYDSYQGNPLEQWKFLQTTIILNLAPQPTGMITTSDIKNPMDDVIAPMLAPYYLVGLDETDPRIRNSQGIIYSFDTWPKPNEIIVTLDSVKSRYIDWVNRASLLVNRELNEVQQPDPLQTLSSANMDSEPWMITPLDALSTLIEFIESNAPSNPDRDFRKIYSDTLSKLKVIHDVTATAIATGSMAPHSNGNEVLTPIEEIYETAQLKYGIVVLQARLEMIVKLSILEYIKGSPEEDQILLAQLLASDRFYETISRMNGTSSFALLREDLKFGQAYTMKNLSGFMELFGFNINRSLRNLYQEELRSSPSIAKINRDLRTGMCFVAMGASNVSQFIDLSLCRGLKIDSSIPGGPDSATLTNEIFNRDIADRACLYREYIRQSDIFQKWQIKI